MLPPRISTLLDPPGGFWRLPDAPWRLPGGCSGLGQPGAAWGSLGQPGAALGSLGQPGAAWGSLGQAAWHGTGLGPVQAGLTGLDR